jgi:type 1 glutamine amidotransferase
LATAVSPEDGAEYPLIGSMTITARVFGTTIGHGPETWDDPAFRDLLVRGFKWAVNRQ